MNTPALAGGARVFNPSHTPIPPSLPSLVAPLVSPARESADEKMRARDMEPPRRVWRVVPTARRPQGPAWVVGQLAHEALHRWRFPSQPNFEVFLYPHALAAGLTDSVEIGVTIAEVRRMLVRFQSDALFAEMDAAERFHEVPYTFEHDGSVETGVIDLLYRVGESWRVVDFKTDEIRDEEKLDEKIGEDCAQVARYADAVRALVGATPLASLCFLNVRGGVRMVSCPVA